jgi:acetolactate synthase I/II/III large subunit
MTRPDQTGRQPSEPGRTVADTAGAALVGLGIDQVFGVVGSGNFHLTNAMVAAGARFVAARHEAGATTMADAYARTSGRPAAVTVHQGCGLTNTLTGLAEAAKSRTPVVIVAAEASEPRSNFFVDQPALAAAVGAISFRVTSAATVVDEVRAAVTTAVQSRRTVLLNLPLHVQAEPMDRARTVTDPGVVPDPRPVPPGPASVGRLVDALGSAARPVFVAGRGARSATSRAALLALAERYGALVATSAVAKGLFHGEPWSLDVSGGFASPVAAELIGGPI